MKPKRINIVPGTKLIASPDLRLDEYRMLFGDEKMSLVEYELEVVTKPRKQRDGINLVRVKLADGNEYEVFYCNILKFTRMI